jgi:uncharacterized repeat protein (TIGR03803 family)
MKNVVFCAAVVILGCSLALGQQYKVLWSFGGATSGDGAQPLGKLVADAAGNLYGTTTTGGLYVPDNCAGDGCGTVFELSPSIDGSWTESVIYNFCSNLSGFLCLDGANPYAGLIFDSAGNLYGTTNAGGQDCPRASDGCGTVFELSPPSLPGGAWTETLLYAFCADGENECPDGTFPRGKLIFDGSGNLYGTTWEGGSEFAGTVFELSPGTNGWTELVLYNFCSIGQYPYRCEDGITPEAGVTFDKSGNLYGTTFLGGSSRFEGGGVVYEISPGSHGWTETVLYAFIAPNYRTGAAPFGEVNFDSAGNLYSTVSSGAVNGGGGVFRLSSKAPKHYTFSFETNQGNSPLSGVLIDPRNENLYGTTSLGGPDNSGNVFKLAKKQETILHSFTGGADGGQPAASLIADKAGNLYGTTQLGGNSNNGVVFEIMP